jgi:hypothetical protein
MLKTMPFRIFRWIAGIVLAFLLLPYLRSTRS